MDHIPIVYRASAGMRLLLLILIYTASAVIFSDEVERCDTCIMVNTTCYNLTYLFDLHGNFRSTKTIHKLGILRRDYKLFYSFEPNITDAEYYKVGFVNLADNTSTGVLNSPSQVFNFGTFDIDQDNGVIYLGGSVGVYQLDTNTQKLTPFSSRFDTIIALFYRNGIYFVQEDVGKVVSKQGDFFVPLLETETTVKNFVITKDGVVVLLTSAGLSAVRNKETVVLSTNPFFRGITIDLDGLIYAWWIDGVYRIVIDKDFMKSKLIKVADIPTIGAMTFDNENNILFTSERALYRLSRTKAQKC